MRTPVVMLHGWTGSKEDFELVAPTLADDRDVVVPDLPGHGAAPPPADGEGGYALPAMAAWLIDHLEDGEVEEFHLVGHSLGGLLAQVVASRIAWRVVSLTLIGSGMGAVNEAAAAHLVRVASTVRDEGMDAAWEVVTEDDDGHDPRAGFVRERFMQLDPAAIVGGARAAISFSPLRAFLHGIDVPVLVCHGEGDDIWLPHEQRLLARTIGRNATYRVIPDAHHSPQIENPDGMLEVLRPFLAAADPDPRR